MFSMDDICRFRNINDYAVKQFQSSFFLPKQSLKISFKNDSAILNKLMKTNYNRKNGLYEIHVVVIM